MALPLNALPRLASEPADLYSGINDFFNMSFDNTRDAASVGPLEIAVVPDISHSLVAGTAATVALNTPFQIDLLGAQRDDSSTFVISSSNGAITFRADTEIRESEENPGQYKVPRGTLVSIDDAIIQIPGEPTTIRFSGLTAVFPTDSIITLGTGQESPISLAA